MRPHRPTGRERGFALIAVLLVLAFVAVVGAEFAYSMRLEATAARIYKETLIATHLAEAGLAQATTVAGTLGTGPEAALARAIVRLPEVVEDAVVGEETQGITAYAIELATAFHAFYRDARVIDPAEPERSASRLALARATGVTLARTLGLLGISAPEAM